MIFKRIKKNANHDHGNCNFILGSCAVVDFFWLMANKLVDVNWSIISPLLMESLFFLCKNRIFWGIGLIHKEYQLTCSASVKDNMADNGEFN